MAKKKKTVVSDKKHKLYALKLVEDTDGSKVYTKVSIPKIVLKSNMLLDFTTGDIIDRMKPIAQEWLGDEGANIYNKDESDIILAAKSKGIPVTGDIYIPFTDHGFYFLKDMSVTFGYNDRNCGNSTFLEHNHEFTQHLMRAFKKTAIKHNLNLLRFDEVGVAVKVSVDWSWVSSCYISVENVRDEFIRQIKVLMNKAWKKYGVKEQFLTAKYYTVLMMKPCK